MIRIISKFNFFLLLVFLSIISSNISGQKITIEQYIEKYKDIAIYEMKIYGIPASITLAQGIEESANGNSTLAREANNHFGIKCQDKWNGYIYIKDDDKKDECFRKYNSVEESFRDHSEFLKNRARYSFLFTLKSNDYEGWAKGLKTAGYATNPKYPQQLINSIEKYKLYKYDTSSEFGVRSSEGKESEVKSQKFKVNTQEINLSSNRQIFFKNGIKAFIAKKGDNYKDLAQELDMFQWQILKYNDLKKTDSIRANEIIYLQAKKRKGTTAYHIYKTGESLRDISQLYGIKLKHLLKKNNMGVSSVPVDGQKLYLQKKLKVKI